MDESPDRRDEAERRPRLTAKELAWIGRRLQMARVHDRHAVRAFAETNGLSTSWLRRLRRRAETAKSPLPVGRPRIPGAERLRILLDVRSELERQGLSTG